MSTDAIGAYTSVEEIGRITYTTWTSKWWSWAVEGPRASNPVFDRDGSNADRGQPTSLGVKFLAGTFDREPPATRSIQSDSHTSLLIPIVNSNISREEHDITLDPTTPNATILGAAGDVISAGTGSLRIERGNLSVDYIIGGTGGRIPERIQYGMDLMFPGEKIVQSKSGKDLDYMYSALDGYWVFLKPLAAGEYKFTIHGEAPWFGDKGQPNFKTDVTYKVTIV